MREYEQMARVVKMARHSILDQLIENLVRPDVSRPRKPRVSTSFVVRLKNDMTDVNTVAALKIIRDTVRMYNDGFKFEGSRLRMIKRGRKPVPGAKYSRGGMLKMSEAREIDVYVDFETKW